MPPVLPKLTDLEFNRRTHGARSWKHSEVPRWRQAPWDGGRWRRRRLRRLPSSWRPRPTAPVTRRRRRRRSFVQLRRPPLHRGECRGRVQKSPNSRAVLVLCVPFAIFSPNPQSVILMYPDNSCYISSLWHAVKFVQLNCELVNHWTDIGGVYTNYMSSLHTESLIRRDGTVEPSANIAFSRTRYLSPSGVRLTQQSAHAPLHIIQADSLLISRCLRLP